MGIREFNSELTEQSNEFLTFGEAPSKSELVN